MERLAPYVAALARVRCRMREPLLIEGELHPDANAAVLERCDGRVRACCVGNLDVGVEAKAAQLQAHNELDPQDWLSDRPDAYFREIAALILELSAEYREAATRLGLPFFDLQPDFGAGVEAVLGYLQSL